MSFPSITATVSEFGVGETALLEALKRDCPEALAFLHEMSHDPASNTDAGAFWKENPNSKRGKQLIRIHASDAARPLVEKHICRGKRLTFLNCCGGAVGGKKKDPTELIRLQIEYQDGTRASADC